MEAIKWHSTPTQFVISIDREAMDKEALFETLRWLRLRLLLQKAGFDGEIEQVGEEILADWWAENQHRFIPAEG